MKTTLQGIAMLLIFGLAAATDGLEQAYGMGVWLAVALSVIAVSLVLVWAADYVEDKPRRRKHKR